MTCLFLKHDGALLEHNAPNSILIWILRLMADVMFCIDFFMTDKQCGKLWCWPSSQCSSCCWKEERRQGSAPDENWPAHCTPGESGIPSAPTARGEEAAVRAEMTNALSRTWIRSAIVTCSATAPLPTVVLTSGITVWGQHLLPSLVSNVVYWTNDVKLCRKGLVILWSFNGKPESTFFPVNVFLPLLLHGLHCGCVVPLWGVRC